MTKVVPRLISLEVDTVDRSGEVSKATITSAETDSDFITFQDARSGGGRDYALAMTLAQDHSDTSLLSIIWDQAGDEVGGVYAPYGNEDPSTMQPHYSFTAIVSEPDGDYLGAEADKSTTAVATTEVEWKLTGKPTKITTAA